MVEETGYSMGHASYIRVNMITPHVSS